MPTTKMPVKSKWGAPMKLLPTSMVAAVTKAIAAIRNMAGWKSTGVFSFSAIPRQIQRVFERLPANRWPDDNGSYGDEKAAEREGVTSEQLARIKAWETTLIDVVKQE